MEYIKVCIMTKFEQSKRLVASGLALTFGTFIMSGIDSNSSATTKNVAKTEIQPTEHAKLQPEVCTQEYKSDWQPNVQFMLGLSALPSFAKELGVTFQTLEVGENGVVNCNPGYRANEIGKDGMLIDVKNLSDDCLVWGYLPKNAYHQKPNAIYKNLAAICVVAPKSTITAS